MSNWSCVSRNWEKRDWVDFILDGAGLTLFFRSFFFFLNSFGSRMLGIGKSVLSENGDLNHKWGNFGAASKG